MGLIQHFLQSFVLAADFFDQLAFEGGEFFLQGRIAERDDLNGEQSGVSRTTAPGGERIPLRKRKGGPESFDVSALASALQLLRQAATVVRVPVYDRRLHEPVPDGLQITPAARIVLIEGNYLLSPSPPWDAVSGCLRPRLFLDVDLPAARERVIARHMRGGSSAEEAVARFEGNDRLNTEAVLATRSRADWLVSLTPSARLRSR